MKCYYIMIRFDGPYVSGFLVPQVLNEEAALKQLKKSIYLRMILLKERNVRTSRSLDDDNIPKLRAFMRSLKRPWRYCGEPRHKGEKKRVPGRDYSVVKIIALETPSHAGFWLKDILLGKEHCNLPTIWEPRPR